MGSFSIRKYFNNYLCIHINYNIILDNLVQIGRNKWFEHLTYRKTVALPFKLVSLFFLPYTLAKNRIVFLFFC